MTGSRVEKVGRNERGGQDTPLEQKLRAVVDGRAAKNRTNSAIKTTDLAVRHFRRLPGQLFRTSYDEDFVAYFHSLSGARVLQPFAERMAVARIFVELGNPLKFLRLWPWSTAGAF
jgi:hypothetical protein